LFNETDLHKECIRGIRMAMDLLRLEKEGIANLLVYCILKKIDLNLEDLKEENNSQEWLKIIET
jgi:hypothetical protein